MIRIDKRETEFGNFFKISTSEGEFEIFFAGNFDLYWNYRPKDGILNSGLEKSFYITK